MCVYIFCQTYPREGAHVVGLVAGPELHEAGCVEQIEVGALGVLHVHHQHLVLDHAAAGAAAIRTFKERAKVGERRWGERTGFRNGEGREGREGKEGKGDWEGCGCAYLLSLATLESCPC